jgi:hypothetical protein
MYLNGRKIGHYMPKISKRSKQKSKERNSSKKQ